MARSRAIDRLRALSSRTRAAQESARSETEETSDAVTDAARSEQAEVVRRALHALPQKQRRVLELAYFDGLTQTEIAAKLNQPLGTIKTRTRSGMMKLRELLKGRSL
jgi:RNA polymerase sigma-70 factor (ECF subfamily)